MQSSSKVENRPMRILVTGGTGFVGRHAVQALSAAGCEVHVTTRGSGSSSAGRVHNIDLLAPTAANEIVAATQPDAILHLAWSVEPGLFWNDAANLDWVAASLRLAQAADAAGVRRFIGVGTCFEYAWPQDGICREEETSLADHTLYDASKSALARILAPYFRARSTRFAWARVFYLLGPGEDSRRFVAGLARALIRGEPAPCTRGEGVRDFLDARDAGAALAAITLSEVEGPVNVGSGRGVKISDIAREIGGLAGRPELVRIGALPDRPDDPPAIIADIGKLKKMTGFAPQYTLTDSLQATLGEARAR